MKSDEKWEEIAYRCFITFCVIIVSCICLVILFMTANFVKAQSKCLFFNECNIECVSAKP